ncbi:MAG: hypothetical protein AB7T49_15460 [Oligoflexales bacterium]
MKNTAMLKFIPLVAVVLITLSKNLPRRGSRTQTTAASMPHSIEGTVVRTLRDSRLYYVLIENSEGKYWVASTREATPEVGTQYTVNVERKVEAFDSKELGMAFDKVFFSQES